MLWVMLEDSRKSEKRENQFCAFIFQKARKPADSAARLEGDRSQQQRR